MPSLQRDRRRPRNPHAEIAALTSRLTFADNRHDVLVRSIDGRLESELLHLTDAAAIEALTRARVALFPSGLTIVNAGYGAQAGAVQMRAERVDDAVRETLSGLKTYDGRTCADLYDELQEVAADIGRMEKRRAALDEQGAQIANSREARGEWIRAINAIAVMLELAGVDERPVLGAIRDAERDADRAAARADARKSDTRDADPAAPNPAAGPVTPSPAAPDPADPLADSDE